MKDFSVPMALVDFIPVLLFGCGAVLLMRDLYNKLSKGAFAIFAAGCIDVFAAGVLKALYKLLYALGVCDFAPLSEMFFPLQSLGFLLAGLGAFSLVLHLRKKNSLAAVAVVPPLFKGTLVFVIQMILGLGLMNTVLSILSVKLKKPVLIVFFALSFVGCLGMGYLSSKDFADASMNWIAQGVNVFAQVMFFLGAWLLHKNGLASLKLQEEEATEG